MPATATNFESDFAALMRRRVIVLTSFRHDGTPVNTRARSLMQDGRIYIVLSARSDDVPRILNNPTVTVAPSSPAGRATGPASEGRGRIIDANEFELISRALKRRFPFAHGVVAPIRHLLGRTSPVGIEITSA